MNAFLSGAVSAGFVVVGLFFLRFWWRTGEALFAFFSTAFWLLALNSILIGTQGVDEEYRSWVYLLRFAAFILIILAIVLKNISARRGRDSGNVQERRGL